MVLGSLGETLNKHSDILPIVVGGGVNCWGGGEDGGEGGRGWGVCVIPILSETQTVGPSFIQQSIKLKGVRGRGRGVREERR